MTARTRPEWRPVHGLFLLDKASGYSSNASLQKVRRLFRAQRAGHTGSLDPLASGLLPICLGEATKLSGYLLNVTIFLALVTSAILLITYWRVALALAVLLLAAAMTRDNLRELLRR